MDAPVIPPPPAPTLPAPLIELHDVAKRYHMGDASVDALRGVSLTVGRGEFLAIMGASGSGKSTLMNIIGCLDRPTAGSYRLDGVEMARQSREALADLRNRGLGFVFQSFNLLARTTALENVELPLVYAGTRTAERRRRARQALERVGLGDRIHHHPNQLSGGQQQRVAIARALVGQPKLILADEPTGNLDSAASAEMMTLLRGLSEEGITLVLVTHEPEIAAYAERIVVFKDGLLCSDSAAHPRGERPPAARAGAGRHDPGRGA